jgi:integrase
LRVYRYALREFEHFAQQRGAQALPASPSTVIEYLTALADAGAKVSTIEVKLAAIAWAHRTGGQPDPTVCEPVKAVMAGIRRELRRAPSKREPVTLDKLEAMLETLPDDLAGKRDRALLLLGFAGAFRRSELVALDVADLSIGTDKLRVVVAQSKTDQEGEGQNKTIPRIGGDLCPVEALEDWLDAAGIRSGAIFRRVGRWGNVRDDRLTSQSVALVVKGAAKAAGLDWRSYSGHSLRRGFITEAMDGGASDSDVMQQTGHASQRVMRSYRQDTGAGASRAVRAAFGES